MNTGRASSLAYGIGRCSARSVDDGHVPFVVALASGGREVVQPFNLLVAQLDAVGGGVLLDAGDAARPVTTKSQSLGFGCRLGFSRAFLFVAVIGTIIDFSESGQSGGDACSEVKKNEPRPIQLW